MSSKSEYHDWSISKTSSVWKCHWVLAAYKATEEEVAELAVALTKVHRPSAKFKAAKSKPAPKSSSGGSGNGKTPESSEPSVPSVPKRSPRAPAEPPAPSQPSKRLRGKTAHTQPTSISPAETARVKQLTKAG